MKEHLKNEEYLSQHTGFFAPSEITPSAVCFFSPLLVAPVTKFGVVLVLKMKPASGRGGGQLRFRDVTDEFFVGSGAAVAT